MMNERQLFDSFDKITPTQAQKDKMFKNIMASKRQEKKVVTFPAYRKLAFMAASFACVIVCAFAFGMQSDDTEDGISTANIEMHGRTITPAGQTNEFQKTLSLNEYYEYLGVDVEDKLDVPKDFTNDTDEKVCFFIDENQNILEDSHTFRYVKDEASVNVATTKFGERLTDVISLAQETKTYPDGTTAGITKIDSEFSAFVIKNSVGYSIATYNLTETENENLLNSIIN